MTLLRPGTTNRALLAAYLRGASVVQLASAYGRRKRVAGEWAPCVTPACPMRYCREVRADVDRRIREAMRRELGRAKGDRIQWRRERDEWRRALEVRNPTRDGLEAIGRLAKAVGR